MVFEAGPVALERPVVDHLIESKGRDERAKPMLAGALRPWHVQSLELANVVVLATGFALHDLLDDQARGELLVAELRECPVASARVHDAALAGCADLGQEGRPRREGGVMAAPAR